MYNPNPKPQEGTWLWLLKIVAGLLIVVILGIHFWVNHLVAPGGLLSYADVLAYYQNPAIIVMEILFLVFVVSHALLGLRSIILDLNPTKTELRWVNCVLLLLGTLAILYGTWLALLISAKGSGA
jgi:succinate dehydrogenase / fumarate reductase membrane anchor subunit